MSVSNWEKICRCLIWHSHIEKVDISALSLSLLPMCFSNKRYVICNILWTHVKIWSQNTMLTTELRCPPVGRLPSGMGTLSRELRQRATKTEVTCTVGAATHVLDAGLDVRFGVYLIGAGAPGLWTQDLVTGGLLKGERRQTKETTLLCCKCLYCKVSLLLIQKNSQTPCMTPAKPQLIPLPLHRGPHIHHLDGGLCVCCQTQWSWFCDLRIIVICQRLKIQWMIVEMYLYKKSISINTIMDELIVDRNTIEISTKSTSTIGIVTIHFHLQHINRLLQVSHLNNI